MPTPIAATAGLRADHRVAGRVTDQATGQGIEWAVINFGSSKQAVRTGADGSFIVSADTAGTYALRVRRVGYQQRVGTVRVMQDSLLVAQVSLAITTTTFDGCGYVQLKERRPWWQWWYPPAA